MFILAPTESAPERRPGPRSAETAPVSPARSSRCCRLPAPCLGTGERSLCRDTHHCTGTAIPAPGHPSPCRDTDSPRPARGCPRSPLTSEPSPAAPGAPALPLPAPSLRSGACGVSVREQPRPWPRIEKCVCIVAPSSSVTTIPSSLYPDYNTADTGFYFGISF